MHAKCCTNSIQHETDGAEDIIRKEGKQTLQDRYMTKCKNLYSPTI